MAETNAEASPLLGSTDADRPRQSDSLRSRHSNEGTPLLSHSDDTPRYDGEDDQDRGRPYSPATASLRSLTESGGKPSSRRRWPTYFAIGILATAVIAIIIGMFFAPAVVEEYAKQSLVIEPTNLSIDSITANGVKARIQANFRMDASRVHNSAIRNIGRLGTWIAKEVESKDSDVQVFLPEYGNVLVGTAAVPRVVVNIRNGITTPIDFVTDLVPGEVDGLRQVANDWLQGRLDKLRLLGKADVALKSGWISLGSQSIAQAFDFEGHNLPTIPEYNITRLNFRDVAIPPDGKSGVAADVSLSLFNSYPVDFAVPPLGFDILVQGCGKDEPYIRLADATTAAIIVRPYSDVHVDVGGVVREVPETLVRACPNSHNSPLDLLLGDYIKGNDATIYVRGSNSPSPDTPDWMTKLTSSVTVPVPFPGHSFDKVIQSFSLNDTHFTMPDYFAEPGSDAANPQISGNIIVIAGLPEEMNFGINVSRVRATADVYYKGNKLGVLDIKKWQAAESERIEPQDIKITSSIKKRPLNITNQEVFAEILSTLFLGDEAVTLKIDALVSVEVQTGLGPFQIKNLSASGDFEIPPISTGGSIAGINPKIGSLRIVDTDEHLLKLQASVSFTNPTVYSATVPFFSVSILINDTDVGEAIVRDAEVVRGNNTGLLAEVLWDPLTLGGEDALAVSRELLSQYISGYNTTLTFRTNNNSIPHRPDLGHALSQFEINVPTPRLSTGKDDDDDQPQKFIDNAIFHLFTSTASFVLHSPLQHNSLYIENINATAFYNHTETVGRIEYSVPFVIPPGESTSPRLPVDWSLGIGYEHFREALGGELKLDAFAVVQINLENWRETIWYEGSGIGASVRL